MKKLLFFSLSVLMAISAMAQLRVQGVPRTDIALAPAVQLADAASFDFDDINNWSGEGSNRAMLVIQWNDANETSAMAFGFRWDGEATGVDMVKAVVANNPRLYTLLMGGTAYGTTVGGLGWDVDGNGDIGLMFSGSRIDPDENGFFSTSSYNFDSYTAADATDLWGSGWYSSYWSYYLKTSSSASWGYASTGASGRKLVDGCWDGWNFARGMVAGAWKPIQSAPSLIPDDAQREFTVDGLCYILKGWSDAHKTVHVTAPFEGSNIEYKGNITVPASFKVGEITYEVVGVADTAFAETAALESVTLPAEVTTIGNEAFKNSAVKTVTYSTGLKKLGDNAFNGCKNLTQIIIPATLTAIPAGAWAGTGISELTIPEHITVIGDNAFAGTKLTSVEIPTTITSIGAGAFSGCPLTAVKSMNLKPATCGDNAFDAATTGTATLTIPAGFIDVYKGENVWKDFVNFAEEAMPVHVGDIFAKSGVTYKVIANSDTEQDVVVTYAETATTTATGIQTANRAFYTDTVNIPAKVNYQNILFNVVAIADSAFYGASNLPAVSIADGGVKSIGRNAFYSCSNAKFVTLTIPESVTTLKPAALRSCSRLTQVTLPSSLTELPDSLLMSCSALTSLEIPAGVTRIGVSALNYCSKLAEANIPASLTSVGEYGFYWTALPQIELPETVTEIGKYAFASNKALASFTWPAAVTTIPQAAFWGCAGLKSVTIPETVDSLGIEVFKGCTSLQDVTLPAGISVWPQGTFYNCKALTELNIPEGVTTLGVDVFNSCAAVTTVTFPNSLTTIGTGAFTACNSIKEITLPERFTVLPDKIFMNCLGLEKVTISSQATKIGTSAFNGCKALQEINLPATVDTIGDMAFNNCANVQITLPENLKYLGSSAFVGNLTITEVDIPETVETLNPYVFQKCANLTKVTGLGRFTTVPNYLFSECTALESVDFEPIITSVGSYAFYKCSNLESFDFGESLTTISASALTYDNKFLDVVLPPSFKTLGNSNFYYNDSIMIWSAMETPLSLSSRYALGTQSGKAYANVTVLNGTKAAYEAANIWKDCTLRELDINGIAAAETEATEIGVNDATLVLNPELTYANEDSVPATFAKFNSARYFAAAQDIVVEYYKDGTVLSAPAAKASRDGVISTPATLNEDGTLVAELDQLKEGTVYFYRVKVLDAEGSALYASELATFTTQGRTAISDLQAGDNIAAVKYYNLAGVASDRPFAGVNIVVTTYTDGSTLTTKQVK